MSRNQHQLRDFPIRLLRTLTLVLVLGLATASFSAQATRVEASTPSSGSLSPNSPSATYTAGPFLVANVTGQAGNVQCTAATPCDDYRLTVSVPSDYQNTYNVTITIAWPTSAADFDLYVLDSSGAVIKSAASSSDPETAIIPAVSGTYTVRVVPFAPLGQSFTGTSSLTQKPAPPPPSTEPAPTYRNYAAPSNLRNANNAGEPSIGANWRSGNVLYQSYTSTYRVTFNDSVSPPQASWLEKSAPNAVTSLDPIMFTDHTTGRTIASQLAGKTSLSAFTDNDGDSWTPSQGSGINSGVDHQTIGGGPFAPGPLGPIGAYPNAVYYCSQDIADASCALSRDGGLTYGPAVPIYSLLDCGGLHGHVKVAPDGTVYVPNKGCGGQQGVAVSTDNGTTWTVRKVPGSTPGDTDPSIGVGAHNTIYFGYQNGDGHPRVAVSHDHGQTWLYDQDVGTAFGIQNVVFPAVVAGDDDRAAFAFLGTPTGGNYQDTQNFQGVWHLYVAHTFDGGQTWTTADATPNDPVQRGSICTAGTTCGNDRNLLDFNDATVDQAGRVLVGYADGCIDACVSGPPNSFSAYATIARQEGGKRLFAQYDPPLAQSDLTITNIVASQNRPGETVLTGTVANVGTADASNVVVRFLEGTTTIGNSAPIATLPKGTSAQVSVVWNTRGLNGDHIITAVSDPANTIAESNEGNNKAQRTISIRGNKVSNGSFEQSANGATPDGWSGTQGTAYDRTGASDGTSAVSATGSGRAASLGNPTWTSAPIAVTAGQTYNLAMNVTTQNLSTAPTLHVTYLNAAGAVLSEVTGISTNITGNSAAQQVLGQISVPPGVAQVRLTLTGFSPTDLATHGTVWFDDIWLW